MLRLAKFSCKTPFTPDRTALNGGTEKTTAPGQELRSLDFAALNDSRNSTRTDFDQKKGDPGSPF